MINNILNNLYLHYLRPALLLLTICSISGCGFTSIYSTNNHVSSKVSMIEILPVDTIEGAEYFDHLSNILSQSYSDTKYELSTTLAYSGDQHILQTNSDVLRKILHLNVSYIIREKISRKIITEGKFVKISSFSASFRPYSNSTIEQTEKMNLARSAAVEVRNRVILFFQSHISKN